VLQLTESATRFLKAAQEAKGISGAATLRISASPGREPQLDALRITFVPDPSPGDAVAHADDITVAIEPAVAPMLDDKVLDLAAGDQGEALVIRG
jgi:Fe-S cluster assembly iron-binding protein IscA